MVNTQNPRGRREPAPNPFKPPRRSNRTCVAKKSQVGAGSAMPGAEDSDETLPEDEYVPGKSLSFSLAPIQLLVSCLRIACGGLLSLRTLGNACLLAYLLDHGSLIACELACFITC